LFSFHDYITGPHRFWLLNTNKTWSAESEKLDKLIANQQRGVVVFNNRLSLNEETHFHKVIGKGKLLRDALESMTRFEFRPSPLLGPHIALHVRMGDFGQSESLDALRAGSKNSRLPMEWYLRILQGLRERIGNVPAIVYSDGVDTSLADLLRLPNVSRSPRQYSVTDMLSISQGSVLISSGSGFSMWGSFLGDIPRICFPGQRFVRVLGEPQGFDSEPEVESVEELQAVFINAVLARIDSWAVD
jgi:hypothetical protein